jgi:ferric-dicitrate binding protein FerR (iron transport regulator)
MEWERLISDYLDDALGPEEVAKLFEWIHSHPDNARQFAAAAFLHRRLQHQLSAMRLLQRDAALVRRDDQAPPPDAPRSGSEMAEGTRSAPMRPSKLRSILASRRFWSAAAILLVVIGVVGFLIWPRGTPARLLSADNAKWGSGITPLNPNDRFPKGTLVLDSGLIKLGFDNGNQLVIEGPASFSITDSNAMTLDQGALTATVTPVGRGLSISTRSVRVTDLGTEFGVKASATATRVIVFSGKVSLDGSQGSPRELSAGSEIEISSGNVNPVPFEPRAFKRVMPADVRPLDLVDLVAGGDGRGAASGVGIDAATGRARETRAVTIRRGNHRYLQITSHDVLDGCFIPDGTIQVDSAGDTFSFPRTSLFSYGLIWAGSNIPWEGELPIVTTLPQDAASPTTRVLVMHSNNGVTFNLDAVRAQHAQVRITGFHARVGNSYRPAGPDAIPARPLASIHVIVDGIARYERLGFASVDPPMDLSFALSENDRFLTLVTTDGGDGNSCDWVLWTHPELLVQEIGR